MTNFFTADPHFTHEAIIRHCKRPFSSVCEMDETILQNLALAVRRSDDLWIIGDFAHGQGTTDESRLRAIFDRIPGRKHLVKGNHDLKVKAVLDLGWTSVHDHMAEVRQDKTRLVMCHYPMLTWDGARGRSYQLFGHVHNNWAGMGKSVNVGVDLWDFKPVTLRDIEKRSRDLPENPIWASAEPGASSKNELSSSA